jgi:hypothetical protein
MEKDKCFRIGLDYIMWLFFGPLVLLTFLFEAKDFYFLPLILFPFITFSLVACYMSLTSFRVDELGIRKINIRYYEEYDLRWEDIESIHLNQDGRMKLIISNGRPVNICIYRLKNKELFIDHIHRYAPEKLVGISRKAPKNYQITRYLYKFSPILFLLTLFIALYLLFYKLVPINITFILPIFVFCLGITIPVNRRYELQQESQLEILPEPLYVEWSKAFNVFVLLVFISTQPFFSKFYESEPHYKWSMPLFFINSIILGWALSSMILRHKILTSIDKLKTP